MKVGKGLGKKRIIIRLTLFHNKAHQHIHVHTFNHIFCISFPEKLISVTTESQCYLYRLVHWD